MKILIVEDDVNYRYAIKTMLSNCNIEFESCREAINGRHALELIREQTPDVIMTDISMPEMNGIELIKSVQTVYPDIYTIVLSAYDDFKFVKDALTLGARDYILKYEINEETFKNIIEDIAIKCKVEKEQKKNLEFLYNNKDEFFNEYFKKIINGIIIDSDQVKKYLTKEFQGINLEILVVCGLQILNNSFINMYSSAFSEIIHSVLDKNKRIIHISLDPSTHVLLGNFTKKTSLLNREEGLKAILKKIQLSTEQQLGVSTAVAISKFFTEPDKISVHFHTIQRNLKQKYYYHKSCILKPAGHLEEYNLVQFKDCYKKLIQGIENIDDEEVNINIDLLTSLYLKNKPDITFLSKMYSNFIADYLSILHTFKINIDDVYDADFFPPEVYNFADNINELRNGILVLYNNLKFKIEYTGREYRKEIREIIDFIELNYHRDLTLEEIANNFCYSPNYLCSLFKNETDERLFRYINKVRIYKAMKLIRKTNMKVYEIAEKTGFKNSSYFSQTFKAITGKSISEYKKTI